MHNRTLGVLAGLVAVSALMLGACGGGNRNNNGGGGPNGAPATLSLNAQPSFGVLNQGSGVTTTTPFFVTTATPGVSGPIAPNLFANAAAGDVHFLEIPFNTDVLASSILSGGGAGQDGIEVRDANGALVPYFLDETGVLDPTNAFPMPGVAPSTVRLYFQAAGQATGTPTALPNDASFTVNLVTSRLKTASGGPFCLVMTNGMCSNPVEVVYGFGTGTDMTPLAPAANPSNPLVNAIIPIDQEIRIFFNDNVDFQSLVGINPGTGMANTTQLDPFMSSPFPVNNVPPMAMATSAGENLMVAYTPPPPNALPPQYGFVLYMPDPFHNPTEVRMRFVDMTLLQPSDAAPMTQNYGLDAAVWTAAGLTPPVNNQGLTLNLPPKLPLPGSDATGTAALAITLFSANNPLATDTSPNGDGMLGITDRARNPLGADFTLNYTLQMGTPIANNPSPPDLILIKNAATLDGVGAAAVTTNTLPGGPLLGLLFPLAQPLNDPMVLGTIRDVEWGAFLNFMSPGNIIQNPPRRLNNALAIASGVDPGVPFPPGGTPENSLLNITMPPFPPPTPPLGVRLYVTDDTGAVRTFDSNTFQPLGSLVGVGNAYGMSRDANNLFVSDFAADNILRIGLNPAAAGTFHQILATIPVGASPTAVSVNGDQEDVLCINSGENSMSVVEISSGLEQERFPVGLGAEHLIATGRMLGNPMQLTLAYQAFVTNTLDNTITVYESDSTNIMVQNGPNGRVVANQGGFSGPFGNIWNFNNIQQGTYVANSTGSTIDHFQLTMFNLQPPPGFPGAPATRTFQVTQVFSTNQITSSPSDVVFDGLGAIGGAAPSVVIGIYPGTGQVATFDSITGVLVGVVQVAGTELYGYFDQ